MADTSGRSDSIVPPLIDTGGCSMDMSLPPMSRRQHTIPADLNIGDELSLTVIIGMNQVLCSVVFRGIDHSCNPVITVGEKEFVVCAGWQYAVRVEDKLYRIFSINTSILNKLKIDIEVKPFILTG